MELVEVSKEDIYCDSNVVAKKFGHKHNYVVTHIENLIKDIENLGGNMFDPKVVKDKREYRGQKYTAYLMNRDFFSLLVMKFKGKKALEWQIAFLGAFNAMEQHIIDAKTNAADPLWVTGRSQLKVGRREETDIIKEFVDYATAQGSTKANYYFKHITNATYKALGLMFQHKPKLRDTMNIYEIGELLLVEKRARELLVKYMGLERNYKDIYESVKNDLILYAGAINGEITTGGNKWTTKQNIKVTMR